MKPGRLENLLCCCLFQDIVRVGWVWVCFEWAFSLLLSWVSLLLVLVFILVLLGLSLLTDKYILPLLGKIVLWKSAKSGLRFQTRWALEMSLIPEYLEICPNASRVSETPGQCWRLVLGAWLGLELYGQAERASCKGSAKEVGASLLSLFYIYIYCPSAPQPRVKECPERLKWLICWKAPRSVCSPPVRMDVRRKKIKKLFNNVTKQWKKPMKSRGK